MLRRYLNIAKPCCMFLSEKVLKLNHRIIVRLTDTSIDGVNTKLENTFN